MKIIRISKQAITDRENNILADYGMHVFRVAPWFISAFTSMKIAKTIDDKEADIIEVYRFEDAMAAISAKKLARHKDLKTVYYVLPNTEVPLSIPQDILNGVDGWIFSSQRLMDAYPADCRNKALLQYTSFEDYGHAAAPLCDGIVISWIGDIKNTRRMQKCLDMVEQTGTFTFRICGAGKAKDVMPLVRMTRHMPNGDKVIWIGEEYRLLHEIAACHAAIITDNDISPLETTIARSGIKIINPEDIKDLIENPDTKGIEIDTSVANYVVALRNYYMSLRDEYAIK